MIRPLAVLGLAIFGALATLPIRAQDVLGETGLKGAGSTFVYPVLSRWSREYRMFLARGGDHPTADGGLDDPPASSALDYEPIGSLGGTLRLKDRAVDFAASDMPMKADDLAQLGFGQFPIVMGGVVVAVNVDGVASGQLKLSGRLLADIFLGKVARWSDAAIVALNPGLRLPNAPIAVVHRSDGSGSTFTFSDYLSKVSLEWKLKVGSALLVQWPTGSGATGNEGVAQSVKATRNSIGYLDYAQSARAGLRHALIQNRAGRFVTPETASFRAAAAGANWARTSDFYLLLTDPPGDGAYPITAIVFVVMRRGLSNTKTRVALDFFQWSLEKGSIPAAQLGYTPLPPALVQQVKSYWAKTFR